MTTLPWSKSSHVFFFNFTFWESRDSTSHRCGPSSIPGRCFMWLEFVVDSHPCSEGYSLGSPVFLPPRKHSKFQCDQDRRSARKPAKADVASSLNISNLLLYFITGVKNVSIYEFARHYFSTQRQNVKKHCKLLSPRPYTVIHILLYTFWLPHFSICHPPSAFFHPPSTIHHPPPFGPQFTETRNNRSANELEK